MGSTGSSSSLPTPEAGREAADIVVGIATRNNAATIGPFVAAVRAGLASLRSASGRIVLVDSGSTDGTVEHARAAMGPDGSLLAVDYTLDPADLMSLPYHGLPGRPRALRAVLEVARELRARACAFVDARIARLAPEWIARLVRPVLEQDCDFVAPSYRRHPYEGAITKSIVAPMIRTLYGVRLHQPATGEFGCSSRLAQHYLDEGVWEQESARVGIDLWMTSTAICGRFRVVEAALGPRSYDSPEGLPDLSTTLAQVVGALFGDLERRVDIWQRVRGSAPVPMFGEPPSDPAPVPIVHVERLIESFRLGYRELNDLWARVLPPVALIELKKLATREPDRFRLDDRTWAHAIYDFALGFRLRVIGRDHLLRSLTPLYLGWMASFILEVQNVSDAEVEARLERLGAAFEVEKPYLISRWRWPERFNG